MPHTFLTFCKMSISKTALPYVTLYESRVVDKILSKHLSQSFGSISTNHLRTPTSLRRQYSQRQIKFNLDRSDLGKHHPSQEVDPSVGPCKAQVPPLVSCYQSCRTRTYDSLHDESGLVRSMTQKT